MNNRRHIHKFLKSYRNKQRAIFFQDETGKCYSLWHCDSCYINQIKPDDTVKSTSTRISALMIAQYNSLQASMSDIVLELFQVAFYGTTDNGHAMRLVRAESEVERL